MKFNIKAAALIMLTVSLTFSACGSGGAGGNGAPNDGPGPNGGIIISAEDGGTINYNNNEINFVVPEKSLVSDTEIIIEALNDIPAGDADGLTPYGQAYKFSPGGTEFDINIPAVIEMKYDETLLAQKGFSPDTLSLYYYDEELKTYVAVSTIVDKDSKKLIANIEHFTVYVPMAKAKLATNNLPYVALQNPVPNPIRAGAPIFVRATVRDYDGSISGAKLYYRKLQPSAGAWNEVVMVREIRLNVADTYGFIIPASFLTSSDLGTGNDFEYYVKATDNLGTSSTTAVRRLNITRIYNPGTLAITPALLNISAGFERSFTVRGRDTGGTTFTLVPENLSLANSSGTLKQYYAGGVYYKAQTVTLSADKLSVGFGAETKTADINVYAGEITSIEILDTNGQKINGNFTVSQASNYEFDAVGYDDYGNVIPILPVWNADPTVGTISIDGILTANFTGAGKINITLGSWSDDQILNYTAVTGVSLDLTEITIQPGATQQLTAAITPADATNNNITWASSNTAIATVSPTGLVTGVTDGSVTITVATADQNKTALCTTHIVTDPFLSVTNPGDEVTVTAGATTFDMIYANNAAGITFPTGMADNGTATITAKFFMGKTEVTYQLWKEVYDWATNAARGINVYTFANQGREGNDGIVGASSTNQEPVTSINWFDAMVWCNALTEYYNDKKGTSIMCVYTYSSTVIRDSRQVNYTACIGAVVNTTAKGFRLPTSMEWEYAARYKGTDLTNTVAGYSNPYFTKGNSASGATTYYNDPTGVSPNFAGKLANDKVAVYNAYWNGSTWINNGTSSTAAVMSKGAAGANSLGLFDMSGNVFEWCFDDHRGMIRGGGYNVSAEFLQVGSWNYFSPDSAYQYMGFRFARTQ